MDTCTIALERGQITMQRSHHDYADNDWLSVGWVVDGVRSTSPAQPVLSTDGSPVLWPGVPLGPIVVTGTCDPEAFVLGTVVVTNLAGTDTDQAAAIAEDIAGRVGRAVEDAVVGYVRDAYGVTGIPAFAAFVGKLGGPQVRKIIDDIGDRAEAWLDDVRTSVEDWISDAWQDVFGGRPACDGVVLIETFAFAPHQPRNEILSRTYAGAPSGHACGELASTEATFLVGRDAHQTYPPLRLDAVPGLVWTTKSRQLINPGQHGVTWTEDLVWFNHRQSTTAPALWDGGRTIGWSWDFPQIRPGSAGTLVMLTDSGDLQMIWCLGYREGVAHWSDVARIGWGWNDVAIICEQVPDTKDLPLHDDDDPRRLQQGVGGGKQVIAGMVADLPIYALHRDGTLEWFLHLGHRLGGARWANDGKGVPLTRPWAMGEFAFSGGEGVIYVRKANGSLRWFRHDGHLDGTDRWTGGHEIGTGWQAHWDVFSTGGGNVYAVEDDLEGTLWWYRHTGWQEGTAEWADREKVGTGWKAATVLANRFGK